MHERFAFLKNEKFEWLAGCETTSFIVGPV